MQSRKHLSSFVLFYAISAATLGCEPAEEGKPYDIRFSIAKLPKESTLLMWTKDDILVADCPVDTGDCIINDFNWLSAKVEKQNELVTFNIHIYNVSRYISHSAKGLWKLRTHTSSPNLEVFYYCNLQVYANPKDIACDLNWLTDSLNVECKVKRQFPEAMMLVSKSNTQFGPISCSNDRLPEETAYYNATCRTQFLHQQLHLKTDIFQFFIYPNIIAFNTNRAIGVNATATLYSVPTNVVLKQCGINKDIINCSCKSLDKKDLHFNWFVHNNEVDNIHDFYITNVQATTEEDIVCKTVIQAENENVTNHCDNSAVIALAILLVIAIVILVGLLIIVYIKRNSLASSSKKSVPVIFEGNRRNRGQKQARHVLQVIRNTFDKRTRQNTMQEPVGLVTLQELRSRDEDITTAFLLQGTPECEVTGVSGTQALKTKNVVSKNIHKVTTTLLLIGTRNSNKELLKRSILQREYVISSKDQNKKLIVDETNTVIIEISKPMFRDFPIFSLPDDEKIQIHYTKRNDLVIKLVDGPVYDTNNINKFIEDMKSCLTLTQEGFNAIIVAFTPDKIKDCKSTISVLHVNFGVDMNYVFSVNIYEKKSEKVNELETDYQAVKRICGERLLTYNIEQHSDEVEPLVSLVGQMKQTCTSNLLCVNKENITQYSELEEILKEMCLLFEIVLNDSQEINDKTKEIVDNVVTLWDKYQDKWQEGVDKGAMERNKENLQIDSNIQEDINHVIVCLKHIYVLAEPMKRCKEILMPSFKTSYQNFHDWYVMSVIKDKDKLLDSNLKMRLSKVMSK